MDSYTPFIGSIMIFGGSYAPEGWVFCDGTEYPIAQYQGLFGVIGFQFGGNKQTTFCVPDLRGKLPIGATDVPIPARNISARPFASQGGDEIVTLTYDEMAPHTHLVSASSTAGNATSPVNNFPSFAGGLDRDFTNAAANETFAQTIISDTGGNQPHDNIQPSLAVNFIVATAGIFPTKS